MTLSLKAQRVVARLAELVAIDTRNPGGSERALAEHLCGLLEERRPDAVALREVDRPAGKSGRGAYVFARWGTPRVVLNAHLDTVATGDGWTGDPFALRIAEDRVTALGAADTKGAIAAIVTALEEAGTPRDCAVLFSGDEEQDSTCMDAFLASELREGIEQAIVCEPTSCRVGRRHRGILALAIDVRGEGGHSSLADTLPAPVLEASRVAVALGAWGETQRRVGPAGFSGLCLNIAELRGGVGYNIIPSSASLVVSVRPPPGASLDEIARAMADVARRASPGVTIRTTLAQPPLQTTDFPAFRALLGVASDEPLDLGFWTEAALFEQAGIGAVVYGPGDIAQAHAADEWVAIADLERACDAFAAPLLGGGSK